MVKILRILARNLILIDNLRKKYKKFPYVKIWSVMTILSEKYLCVGEKIHILKSNEKRNNSMKNGHRGPKSGPEVHLNGPHKTM